MDTLGQKIVLERIEIDRKKAEAIRLRRLADRYQQEAVEQERTLQLSRLNSRS